MNKQKPEKNTLGDLTVLDAKERRSVITYSVLVILITLLPGSISIINLTDYLPGLLVKAIQIIAFIGCGMIHISFINKNPLFPGTRLAANSKLVFSVLLSLVISLVLMLLYLFTNGNMIGMSFASGSSFLLPFVIQQASKTYNNFPQKRYKLWYNSDVVMDTRTTIFLNSLPIRLQLSMKYFDIEDEVFELTVPGHTQFGKFFNQFIIEKNKNNPSAIECIDLEKKPFGWQFYIQGLGGLNRKYLDPELSLRENNVKDHSTIIAKRQRTGESIEEELPLPETKALPKINRTTSKINKHEAGK
jgi:hypothetical protein